MTRRVVFYCGKIAVIQIFVSRQDGICPRARSGILVAAALDEPSSTSKVNGTDHQPKKEPRRVV